MTNLYNDLKAALDEEQWALSDAHKAATDPAERDSIMAAIEESIGRGRVLDAAHRGEHTGTSDPDVLAVLVEALEREEAGLASRLAGASRHLGDLGVLAADDIAIPFAIVRDSRERYAALAERVGGNREAQDLARGLLAHAEAG